MRRSCSRRSTSRPTRWPRRSASARRAAGASTSATSGAIDDELLRGVRRVVIVACGTAYHAGLIGRYAIEQWARVPVEVDIASEYRYRNPVVGPGRPGDRDLAVRRDRRHAGGDAHRPRARRHRARGDQHHGRAGHPRGRRRPLHARRPGDRRRRDQDVRQPDHGDVPVALRLAEVRGDDGPRGAQAADRRAQAAAAHDRRAARARRRRASRRSPRLVHDADVLPLPRAPHRAAGRARGRAQAQGDLLHRHRRLRRRGDEARPDRAAR